MTSAAARARAGAPDDGTATAEIVVLMVVFFLLVATIVFAGRVTVGASQVEAAARSAARTISIARDPDAAFDDAEEQARAIAGDGTAVCTSMSFDVDTSDPGRVQVSVACSVDLGDVALVEAIPGTLTVDASAVEVVDRHREGSP